MMKHPLVMVYGLALLGWAGWNEYRGIGWNRPDEVKNVPKSVRNNPGAYRSHYSSGPRYYGGK